jgi:hypothetical protein
MSAATPPAFGAALSDALAGAEPAAVQQLQQLAAPAGDADAKAAALQALADEAGDAAEAATARATQDLDAAFSSITPTGQPAVPCACADCIGRAVDPAVRAISGTPAAAAS